MRALSSLLRKQLETAVLTARRAAEGASRAAVDGLGVFADRRPEHLDSNQATLRNGLRAKWRQLGGDRDLLVAECAYEQWHRLLFARFLAENSLLLHPQYRAPVTLADCGELAAELGEPDAWAVAARFAAEILPGIFRLDDPCVRLRFAPEGRYALEQILDALPAEMFVADDALGWVYQFWQKDKKDEINASERKIGGADLGPVTQLFTENYMVRFLLENSLGAWWAARHPGSPLVKSFGYLRFDDDGRPAAGAFDGWPERVAEVTVMDPCCGSGHFLVEAFSMLWAMRAEEEKLGPVAAQDSVLRDNLFGLELDPRCVQIAMFAVALQAWKAGGGWRQLPVPNIACSGVPVKAPVEEWKQVARGDSRLEAALVRLHTLFRDADTLGSLIDPRRATELTDPSGLQRSFDDVDWEEITPLFESATRRESSDPATAVLGADAAALSRAARLLGGSYSLVVTNVPYLTSAKQSERLKAFAGEFHSAAKADLATTMIDRCRSLVTKQGTFGALTPEKLLFLGAYARFRRRLLSDCEWDFLALVGIHGFSTPMFDLGIAIAIFTSRPPTENHLITGLTVETESTWGEKARSLPSVPLIQVGQLDQQENPDARVSFIAPSAGELLENFAKSYWGLGTGDDVRYVRRFSEIPSISGEWIRHQGTVARSVPYGGRERVLRWSDGRGSLSREPGAFIRGTEIWGSAGVVVTQTGGLLATLYTGDAWDQNCAPIIPTKPELLPAIWAYCSSAEFAKEVRRIDRSLKVTNATLLKVPFDVEHWRKVAEEAGPLPEPWSDDPTQWLFEGRPEASTAPLQVAVARLLGYRWPEQAERDDLNILSDSDGIVCLPSVAGEAPAADRVLQVLAATYRDAWTPAKAVELLEQAESTKKNLVDWLRDEFFKQHCALFANRPFVWHIWDGQRDGFSALVNYHRLDGKMLEKLTYTYLGQDWVERQRAEVRDEVAGADTRLSAALALQRKLKAILDGEERFDIYVRWKEKHEQPIGWEPDLNDGVRLNVRPFVEAGVLRAPFNIHWRTDRGKNPDGSERENDKHYTVAEKLEARRRAGRS